MAAATCAAAHVYYVAPDGSDTNTGVTLDAPFRTIQQAARVMLSGDVCRIRAGVYRETVTPAHSGAPGAPIVFEPYSNEVVTISGTEMLSGWELETNAIYTAPMAGDFFVSRFNQADQLFMDGRMLTQAKWPNVTTATNAYPGGVAPPVDINHPAKSTLSRESIFKLRGTDNWTVVAFEDDALEPQSNGYYAGAEIHVQPNHKAWSWTLSGTVISQLGNRLVMRTRNNSGKDGGGHVYAAGSRYYLFNQPQMLDAPGEWYHDKTAGRVAVWLPGGAHPSNHVIEAKARDLAFNLDGKSYIVIRGLRLFGCTISTDTASGGDCLGYTPDGRDRYPWRGGRSIAPSHHITLDGITAQYLSHFTDVSGHFFLQWGQGSGIVLSGSGHLLQNSFIQYSAGNGVAVLGCRNKVLNNVISDVNYMSVDCAGITTGGAALSEDHEIACNTITRAARSGITPRGLGNADLSNLVARIHHNDISHCMLQDWDGGGIYSCGPQRFLRVDHNLIHDIIGFTGSGIYPDWGRDMIVDHNVIWNLEWGVHLQATHGRAGVGNYLCYNNTIVVRKTEDADYGPFGFVENCDHPQTGTVVRNNIIVCETPPPAPGYRPMDDFTAADVTNNITPATPAAAGFVNAAACDFRLASNAVARAAATPIPAFERAGVLIPAFNEPNSDGSLDAGAYPFGTHWTAGASLPVPAP